MNNVWRFFVCVMCVGSSDTQHTHKHNTRITRITRSAKPETAKPKVVAANKKR